MAKGEVGSIPIGRRKGRYTPWAVTQDHLIIHGRCKERCPSHRVVVWGCGMVLIVMKQFRPSDICEEKILSSPMLHLIWRLGIGRIRSPAKVRMAEIRRLLPILGDADGRGDLRRVAISGSAISGTPVWRFPDTWEIESKKG